MYRSRFQNVLLYATIITAGAIILFPIYWLLITALSSTLELSGLPPTFWPADPDWSVFGRVLEEKPIVQWLINSTLAASGAVSISMAVSVLAGYALSRFRMRASYSLGIFILTAKMLPVTLMVIPLFALFRSLDMIGSLWTVIIAQATLIIPFTTWMLKGYFDTIPRELEQAAMVDGCSPIEAMFRVILPISSPGLAATALYAFVLSWSEYAYARTFLVSQNDNWTANLGVATMRGEFTSDWNEIAAASVFVALPIILIYLFLERYLVGGLTAGAEK